MTCNGNCCEQFVLPYSKEIMKRKSQNGEEANGTLLEMKMLADMVIPVVNKATVINGSRYFFFTCKHFNKTSRKCMIYEKRPVLCRTYPNNQPCGHASLDCGGCEVADGTGQYTAMTEFKKSHGLIKEYGNDTRLQQLSETPKV